MANQGTGKAASEIPALKPDWGKPTVRNFRECDGNSGIIEARQAPLPYPTAENSILEFPQRPQGWNCSTAPEVRRLRNTSRNPKKPAIPDVEL
jgi:hypothetical protein